MAYTKAQREAKKAASNSGSTTKNAQTEREFQPTDLIAVKNGFQGRLIYVSKRQNGVTTIWNEFGDVEYLELAELVSARNTAKTFFSDNQWIIDDPEVLDYLGVAHYYANSLALDEFDKVLTMNANQVEELKNIILNLPNGQKRTLSYRAKEKIQNGDIDSRKVIEALEEALGVQLIEK